MADYVLGIDLGTTNSVVAVADGGQARVLADADGARLIPSVVSFHPSGELLVGMPARERRLVDAANTIYAVKRLIGRPFDGDEVRQARRRFPFKLIEDANGGVTVDTRKGPYTLAEISGFVLRELARVAADSLGNKVERAVITVPANFNELQRSATKLAAELAGLKVLRIINEPTAAAVAYGYGKRGRQRIAVYDLGGGTFDFSLLELNNDVFQVVATGGDSYLGGDDIDVLLAERLADAFLARHRMDPRTDGQAFERIRAAAEWAKCMLSTDAKITVRIPELGHGPNNENLGLEVEVTQTELAQLSQPLLGRSFDVCNEAMAAAKLNAKDIDSVLLVGGSTRSSVVRAMVREFFGQEPKSDIDPDLVVSIGAAMQGHALSGASPQRALGRLALKKVTPAQLAEAKRKRELGAESRPEQPAFAPPRPTVTIRDSKRPPRPSRPPPPLPDLPTPASEVVTPVNLIADGALPVALQQYAPPRPPGQYGVAKEELAAVRPPPLPATRIVPPPVPVGEPARPAAVPPALPRSATPARTVAAVGRPGAALDLGELAKPAPALGLPSADGALGAPAGTASPSPSETASPGRDIAFSDTLRIDEPFRPTQPSITPLAEDALIVLSVRPPSPAPEAPIAMVEMADTAPPLLLDVTSHSLAIETAGGYAEQLVRRNAAIPIEQTRIFTTAQDDQEVVVVSVCQGESRSFGENQVLGALQLTGLRKAARGDLKIQVTFALDANGTLDVRAVDLDTGREQTARIRLLGGADAPAIEEMRARHEAAVATMGPGGDSKRGRRA